jgi:hypothetical protein
MKKGMTVLRGHALFNRRQGCLSVFPLSADMSLKIMKKSAQVSRYTAIAVFNECPDFPFS